MIGELIDAEVTDVAGPKGKHDPNRAAVRHGIEAGKRHPRRKAASRSADPRVRTVADEAGVEREVHVVSHRFITATAGPPSSALVAWTTSAG